ncbi:hypothetical protein ON010_g5258 [Phytophthora cinnamomi]|nr:hypothetical protein ON010_g5258 [Phytophthora cinnamomi]
MLHGGSERPGYQQQSALPLRHPRAQELRSRRRRGTINRNGTASEEPVAAGGIDVEGGAEQLRLGQGARERAVPPVLQQAQGRVVHDHALLLVRLHLDGRSQSDADPQCGGHGEQGRADHSGLHADGRDDGQWPGHQDGRHGVRPGRRLAQHYSRQHAREAAADGGQYHGRRGSGHRAGTAAQPNEIGSHVAFDITEIFENKLDGKTETIAFSIHAPENSDAVVFGVHHVAEDYFPQIVVEDLGLELMHEVAYFKESVFTLRGDISFVKHRERMSRDAAESTNARVKWMSLITNVVLVGIAFGQVIYIRSMLGTPSRRQVSSSCAQPAALQVAFLMEFTVVDNDVGDLSPDDDLSSDGGDDIDE